MDYLDRAIAKFNHEKMNRIHNGVGGEFGHYGKWNDDWNIDNVLLDALRFYEIDKLFNTRKYGKTRSYN